MHPASDLTCLAFAAAELLAPGLPNVDTAALREWLAERLSDLAEAAQNDLSGI